MEPKTGKRIVGKGKNEEPDFYTQLCEAASNGDAVTVQWLLSRGVGPDKPVFFCAPALLHAVVMGQEKIVRLLLKAHADVNAAEDFGFTSLMGACRYGLDGRPDISEIVIGVRRRCPYR